MQSTVRQFSILIKMLTLSIIISQNFIQTPTTQINNPLLTKISHASHFDIPTFSQHAPEITDTQFTHKIFLNFISYYFYCSCIVYIVLYCIVVMSFK
ncbi:hypothetical protein RhiirA4_482175 [Rhizophagus irregularis]|uniref:Uncharacterized protein n=1 Tax=Rhizophagus irregularis TaxID=588596 RepID=A0A2I1HKR3_9GLOM|nr:hypothetical protein RhiirA4_482175 [Rhizophagus irregularis]